MEKIECSYKTEQFTVDSDKLYYYDIPENSSRKKIKIFATVYASFTDRQGVAVYLTFGHRPYSSYTPSDIQPLKDACYCAWLKSFAQTSVFEDEETSVCKCIKSSIHVILKPYGWFQGFAAPVRVSHYEKS